MTWIPTVKATAITAVLALIALAVKFSGQLTAGAWLRPPYLYIVINGIILCIAVSSRFHNWSSETTSDDEKLSSATRVALMSEDGDDHVMMGMLDRTAARYRRDGGEIVADTPEVIKRVDRGADPDQSDLIDEDDHDLDDERTVMMVTPKRRSESWEESILILSAETPQTLIGHREPACPDHGGLIRTSKVTEPEQHQTLESTWKAITEGRSTPLTRHVNKCDSWQNSDRQMVTRMDHPDPPPSLMKSKTFKSRKNQQLPPVVPVTVVRKEPSLSQDELNRRVEAFIKKVNDEMRLQRQESLDQYMEMMGRGAH